MISKKNLEREIYAVNMAAKIDYDEEKAVKMIHEAGKNLFDTLASAGLKPEGKETKLFVTQKEAKDAFLASLREYLIERSWNLIHFRKYPILQKSEKGFYVVSRLRCSNDSL